MDNTEQVKSIFDELHDPLAIRRKKMIPKWIRVFSWIFIVLGILVPILFVIMCIGQTNGNITIYGFSTTNAMSPVGVGGAMLFIFKAITGYGLITEKDWAVNCAILDGWLGIALCIFQMIAGTFITEYQLGDESGFHMRVEIFFIIPYLFKMHKIRRDWQENAYTRQQAMV